MRKLGRVIRLSEGGSGRLVRFVSESIRLGEGQPTSWVTVTRTGDFSDPRYGAFAITRVMLDEMVKNFAERTYGQDIFIDVAHRPDGGAAGKVVALAVENDRLRAKVEWTPMGVDAVKSRGFSYLSAEYHENWRDNEAGLPHGCVLLGAGLVTRPCIKRLDPVVLGEKKDGEALLVLHPKLLDDLKKELSEMKKKYLDALRKRCGELNLADDVTASLVTALGSAMDGDGDEKKCQALLMQFEDAAMQFCKTRGPVSVTVQGMTASDVNAAVDKALGEREEAARKLAEGADGKRKLLADTINEAGKGLPEAVRKELTESLLPEISGEMPDAAIRLLAETQVKMGERLEASKILAAQGFSFRGDARITVDSSNEVKALQEAIDKRLGIKAQAKDSPNTEFVEKVLAQYDANNGAQLSREHKMLAGGDGIISDVAVPAIFERTVIREALYPVVSLQFLNVGSSEFASQLDIPYSYRDAAAAGVVNARRYEGQGVARAGIKQVIESAYPVPQKLAFEVSDELRYLTGAGRIDFDSVAENVRNAARVISEDTERLITNELVNACDEFAVTSTTDTLTATVNGSNKVFVTANFPVVRPRKLFNLQGGQIGSTVNPMTVTLNAVVRNEYDGTNAQSAGTYYTMDYNIGELRFVTELGASVTPTNGWVLTVAYYYTTNVHKFDTDLGSLTVGAKWDDFIYRYGLRRSVLEDQRFYKANFGLMSGAVHEQILQANQFAVSLNRGAAVSGAAGDLGPVRSVPNFKTFAPGLQLADSRVLIGERGTTRYRMMKPWQMGELENQKDASGRFTGKKEAYGDQFVVVYTPTLLKGSYTSIVLFSTAGRVARVA